MLVKGKEIQVCVEKHRNLSSLVSNKKLFPNWERLYKFKGKTKGKIQPNLPLLNGGLLKAFN